MEINKIELLSVGIDVGSSTSHLVFSNLILIRDEKSPSRRFRIEERRVIHEGRIIHTPLFNDKTIDIDTLTGFFREECAHAGIDPADIQTGAVIVTGETAKSNRSPALYPPPVRSRSEADLRTVSRTLADAAASLSRRPRLTRPARGHYLHGPCLVCRRRPAAAPESRLGRRPVPQASAADSDEYAPPT